jgi:hypothetical protein
VIATGTEICPVAALRTWLEAAGITDDAVCTTPGLPGPHRPDQAEGDEEAEG